MPPFVLDTTPVAKEQLAALEADAGLSKQLKAVRKALGWLETQGPSYPGLNVHPFKGRTCPHDDTLYEAYAQNRTPSAWRIFFCYAPKKGRLLIVAITPHP